MTLTVRLDTALATALELHCAAHGVPKSVVVQQSLAQYLIGMPESPAGASRTKAAKPPGSAFVAFQRAGLFAAAALDGAPADKAAVRRKVQRR